MDCVFDLRFQFIKDKASSEKLWTSLHSKQKAEAKCFTVIFSLVPHD